MNVRVSVEPHASGDAKEVVNAGIYRHNVAATSLSEFYEVNVFLRGEHEEILGGALGHIWGGWLQIGMLWVAHPLRGQGYGAQLLQSAEEIARQRGCVHVTLDTHSFQAPGFYQKQGYEVFGVLEEYPPGHQRIFFKKVSPELWRNP